MISFDAFHAAAPSIATNIRNRFDAAGMCLLATLRRDGSPRASAVEVTFDDGRLMAGMMPGSMKALDLLRDPRCSLMTTIADKDDVSGEGKLFAHAIAWTDPQEITRFLGAIAERLDMDVDAFSGSHVFEIQVSGAAWQHVDGDAWVTESWNEGQPVRLRRRAGANGEAVDVTA
ncbi:MAG: pyridoxamine 5'-phosphate oxidase family protein [Acidimicrobiia bacterium]